MTPFPDPEANTTGWTDAPCTAQERPQFWVSVDNFVDLTLVFSLDLAADLVWKLCDHIDSMAGFAVGGVVLQDGAAHVNIVLAGEAARLSYREILIAVGLETYPCQGEVVTLALSAQPALADLELSPPTLRTGYPRDQWLEDMRRAVAVHEAIREQRLFLLYQPVATSPQKEAVLYHECLARIVGRNGEDTILSPSEFIPALERLELTRLFDAVVMRDAVDLLRSEPDACLGCSVSALSACNDLWWQGIQQELLLEPDLAARLVVKVIETAMPPDLKVANAFIETFQNLGCRTAIDDFGAGFSSLRIALKKRPDIVKIDGSFVKESNEHDFCPQFFPALVNLAACLADHVVVDGISMANELERAQTSGALWFQGYHIGKPTLGRCPGVNHDVLLPMQLKLGADERAQESVDMTDASRAWHVPGGMQ